MIGYLHGGEIMNFLTIGEFAKSIGKSVQTVRLWDKSGKLKPHHVTEAGTRYYTYQQVREYLVSCSIKPENNVIAYCRVGLNAEAQSLDKQECLVKAYCESKDYKYQLISDVGDGFTSNSQGLLQLIKLVMANEVDKIVILNKDRLLFFGYEWIYDLCKSLDVEIEVIRPLEEISDVELNDQIVNVLNSISKRVNGKKLDVIQNALKEFCLS